MHIAAVAVPPPAKLPDLYPVVFSAAGCVTFVLLYIYLSYRLLSPFYCCAAAGGGNDSGSDDADDGGGEDKRATENNKKKVQ